MRQIIATVGALIFVALAGLVRGEELLVCGWDEVFLLEVSGETPKKSWSWSAAGRPELPKEFRDLFETTDECKPIEGGRKVLISSSGGGVALVDCFSGQVLWHGRVGNAHSIELLPGERVAVAGSTHENGNRLAIFDLRKPDEALFSLDLYSGHGVVWDAQRGLLWALGFRNLYAYGLVDWETGEPKLELVGEYELPDSGGHDLCPWYGTSNLIVTTHKSVLLFDRDQREFSLHPELGGRASVKGVSVHPVTGRIAYVQAEGENWWSSRIKLLNPEGTLVLAGERIYKARWVAQ